MKKIVCKCDAEWCILSPVVSLKRKMLLTLKCEGNLKDDFINRQKLNT